MAANSLKVRLLIYQSAVRTAEFMNYISRNVVVASKSGPVETVPTVPVATALGLTSRSSVNHLTRSAFKHREKAMEDHRTTVKMWI